MDFTVKKDIISAGNCQVTATAEHMVNFDLTLPEYMPDVVRVLKCSLEPNVASHQLTGDRISTECDCTLKVIYVCEKGQIHCASQTEHFGKQLELRNKTVEAVTVSAKTEFVNYRVGSNRKIEIHGSILVMATCMQKSLNEIVSSAEGDGITVRSQKRKVCTLVGATRKAFQVSETCEVNCSDKISSVISVNHCVRTSELKAIHGKVFVRGELCVRTSCLTESGDILCFENLVGINQILDVQDVTEESIVQIDIKADSLCVRPRAEMSNERGLLDVEATLCASVRAYEIAELTVVSDAYSTRYETDLSCKNIVLNSSCEKMYDTFLCRETVDVSPVGIRRVLSFSCVDISSNEVISEGNISVTGIVTAECVFEDTNSEIYFVTRQIPFEYKHGVAYENVSSSSISSTISAYNFVTGSGGTLDVRIEILVSGLIFCGEEERTVTEISLDKSKCKTTKTASLTVYFAEENESIWDIARRYNTTTSAILRENRMQDEKITGNCKLLIPKI